MVHREEEKITSAAMIRLFADLAARHPAAERVTVVLDNARYNRSRALKAWLDQPGCRLRLVHLPSYAPNLNLIEGFWHFLKRKVLFNRAQPPSPCSSRPSTTSPSVCMSTRPPWPA